MVSLFCFLLFVVSFVYLTVTRQNKIKAEQAKRSNRANAKQEESKPVRELDLQPVVISPVVNSMAVDTQIANALPQTQSSFKKLGTLIKNRFKKVSAFMRKPEEAPLPVYPAPAVVWPDQIDYSRFETPTFFRKISSSQVSCAGHAI